MLVLGPYELVVILVIVVFLYGGKRLSQIGEGLGKSISEFKKAIRSDQPPAPKEGQKKLPDDKDD